ncbi:MAG: Methyltransferase domain [Actinomycetia bacterium]|nr:Methyltransferase domain [Actinomycetes bacterium]
MTVYALLLRPGTNRVYSKNAADLNAAELAVVNAGMLRGALHSVEPTVIGGVDYVRFEADDDLGTSEVGHISNLSSAFALFRIIEDTSFVPVPLTPMAYLDDDLLTIMRYKGKTNEQFTKLLFNVTLAASAHATDWPGRRLRVLDPVCGRGTSLNQGLAYGFDVDGIEIDRTAYDAYRTFFVTWLKDKRFKHQATAMPLRRDGKVAGRRVEIVFARDKDEYKADDVQRMRLVNDDTTQAGEHYRKPVFDLVVGDLPYGVQHASRAHPNSPTRDPRLLVEGALRGWTGAMKPGAALGLSFNAKVLERAELVEILHARGLVPVEHEASFEHRVDHAITRDLVVAVKPAQLV